MTYKDLLNHLIKLTEEQLNCDVTVFDQSLDEFYPICNFLITDHTDILDKDHPYLTTVD